MARRDAGKELVAIARAIVERADMHGAERGERAQHVVGADLVPPIGRERHAMRQEQGFARHASPLAMTGPIALATGSGSFFHRSLVGSTSRGAAPGALHRA